MEAWPRLYGWRLRSDPRPRMIPKRLRQHAGFDRKLLGKLSSWAWACIKAEARALLGREAVVPGVMGAIQTHGRPWIPFPLEFTISAL